MENQVRTNHSQLKRQHKTGLATTSQWYVSCVSGKLDGNTSYVSYVFIFLKMLVSLLMKELRLQVLMVLEIRNNIRLNAFSAYRRHADTNIFTVHQRKAVITTVGWSDEYPMQCVCSPLRTAPSSLFNHHHVNGWTSRSNSVSAEKCASIYFRNISNPVSLFLTKCSPMYNL